MCDASCKLVQCLGSTSFVTGQIWKDWKLKLLFILSFYVVHSGFSKSHKHVQHRGVEQGDAKHATNVLIHSVANITLMCITGPSIYKTAARYLHQEPTFRTKQEDCLETG